MLLRPSWPLASRVARSETTSSGLGATSSTTAGPGSGTSSGSTTSGSTTSSSSAGGSGGSGGAPGTDASGGTGGAPDDGGGDVSSPGACFPDDANAGDAGVSPCSTLSYANVDCSGDGGMRSSARRVHLHRPRRQSQGRRVPRALRLLEDDPRSRRRCRRRVLDGARNGGFGLQREALQPNHVHGAERHGRRRRRRLRANRGVVSRRRRSRRHLARRLPAVPLAVQRRRASVHHRVLLQSEHGARHLLRRQVRRRSSPPQSR